MTQALIRFTCSCGKRFVAPAGTSGRKGKCKKCGKLLVVPDAESESAPVESAAPETPPSFEHPFLGKCYDIIVEQFKKRIDRSTVEDGRPRFRFVLPEHRKQEIQLLVETDESHQKWLLITSEVGTATTIDEMRVALQLNRRVDSCRLYLDDSQVLHLESRQRLEDVTDDAVVQAVKQVAMWADEIEEKLFMIDLR